MTQRYTNTPCGRTIADAEKQHGPLTIGQKARILLDRYAEIADVDEAKKIIAEVTLPPTCGGTEHQNCSDHTCSCACHTQGLAAI